MKNPCGFSDFLKVQETCQDKTLELIVTTILSDNINDQQMCIRHHCFIVRTKVSWFIFHSLLCFTNRWEAGKSDAPKVEETFPHFLPNGIFIHLGIDFQEMLAILGVFRPTHWHLQVSSVWVAAGIFNNRCVFLSYECEQSGSQHGRRVTPFLQSLSSRQSYSQKVLSVCPRTSTKRWMAARKHTAHRQNGQHPTNHDRVCLVQPSSWAPTACTSKCEQT